MWPCEGFLRSKGAASLLSVDRRRGENLSRYEGQRPYFVREKRRDSTVEKFTVDFHWTPKPLF